MASRLTDADIATYHEDGLLFLRELFDAEETGLLRRSMEEDPEIQDHSLLRADQEGGATRISLWNTAGDSVYGLAARCERIVETAEALIGEPVYHFQSKLTAKDPKVGGAWEWHQDYGYWYCNGCVAPKMLSFMIALDRTDTENGCLKLIRKSHKLGRLDQNRSDKRRWTLLCCYNAISNDTVTKDDDRYYVPLDKVPDSAIMSAGLKLAGPDNMEHFTSKPYVPDLKKAS